jgi:hypothetical protein
MLMQNEEPRHTGLDGRRQRIDSQDIDHRRHAIAGAATL